MRCNRVAVLVSAVATILALQAQTFPAAAQQWPTKPIRFVVPYAPGGINDIAARIVGGKLTEKLGQQVIVENRSGGNGVIGTTAVVKAAPDGYTYLVVAFADITVSPHIMKNLPYNVETDLIPITSLTDTPVVLATHVGSPYKSVADVIADAKKQPGKISYSSPSVGTINHLLMEWTALETGTSFSHIPYKGGGPAGAALAAGDVPLGMLAVSSAIAHVKSGKVRLLANTAARRSPHVADLPTLRESGVPVVEGSNATVILAPKGTPAAILSKANAEIVQVLAMDDVKTRLAAGAATPIPSTAAEIAARLKKESAALKIIVEKAKIVAE